MIKTIFGRATRTTSPLLVVLVCGGFLLAPVIARVSTHAPEIRRDSSKGNLSRTSEGRRGSEIKNAPSTGILAGRFEGVWRPHIDFKSHTRELLAGNGSDNFFTALLQPLPTASLTAPSITGLSPSNAIAGDSGFTLTVSGSDFGVDPVTINFGGTPHAATIDDATHVSTSISAAEIATAGTIPVNVTNSASETSTDLTFAVSNPVAVLSSLLPSSKTAGQTTFALTVSGSSFVDGAQVKFNGSNRTTLFVSDTDLIATITTADIATAGSYAVTVVNPGVGPSNSVNLVVNPPVPTISALAPSSKTAGDAAFTLTITGSSYVAGAVIHFGGTDHTANLDNATHVSATISAAEIATPGTIPVTVSNPSSNNSGSLNFTVNNPVAVLSSLSPASKTAGLAAFDLTVNGSSFVSGAQVKLNGSNRTTTLVSSTQLTAQITAADIAVAGSFPVTVVNSGAAASNTLNLVVNNPVPSISALGPNSKIAGDTSFTLTVTGSSFVTGAVIHFGGTDHAATLDDATHVSATISTAEVATAGTIAVTVSNPGSSNSGSLNFTVNNPVPSISALSPNSKIAGDSSFTLTVTGSSYVAGAVIHFGGTDHTAAIVDATHVSATISAAEIATPGIIPVTVSNAGSSNSASLNFTVNNPVPSLSSLNPNPVIAGTGAFTLTVNGSSFANGAQVSLDGANRTTSFVSSTQLTAAITAADIAAIGTRSITVLNPSSSGPSAGLTLSVNNPVPALTSLDPTSAVVGEPAFLLNVAGTNFVNGATINFGGTSHTATFVNSTLVRTIIETTEISTAGVVSVTVTNPSSVGGASSPISFTVNNPVPGTTSLTPSSKTAGTGAFLLTVSGTNFVSGSTIQFGNTSHAHDAVFSTTQVRTIIEATEIATGGVIPVTVTNPAPGGGISVALNFTLNNPSPTLTSLTPTTKVAGDSGFTLTVNGTNFNSSSVVRLDGSDRVTALVSTTQLTAQITTADLVAAGTHAITVNNPAPGGGTSSSSTLTVNNPTPTITTIAPDNKIMGETAFTLTVNGTNFNASSVVRLDGSARGTNFVSATQLTAQIATADLGAAGTRAITVNNPAPGGGTSGSSTLTVNNPAPTLASISPTSTTVGQPGFTLTVNGSNFNTNSVVQLDGASRSTAFVSATQLTAQITAADIASAGTPAITVFNPLPGGGTSSAVNLSVIVSNPVPAVTTVSPNTRIVGDAAFTLTVNGSNFVSASVVRVDGSDRGTTFVNGGQLTAQITLADLATSGTRAITVFNPTPGGGLSNAVDLAVNNPTPSLSNIAPTSKTAGDIGFTLTVNGSNFVSASTVRLDGTDRVTAFVNATQLTAQITAADLTAPGTRAITVFNPAPGGGTSSAVNLTVNNPGPTVTTLSPSSKIAGDAAFTLTVNGTNFNGSSIVRLDGTDRTTAFVSATQLTAQITLADVAAAGTRAITVFNPAPAGGTSSAVNLTVNNPGPTVTTLSPNSKIAGDLAFTLTVNGTNFNSASVVRLAGSDRTTAFVSATQLTADITAADLATAGTRAITVFNPAPGGGTSSAVNLTVNNPSPTVTSLAPSAKIAGDAGFTLTVDGTNFNSSSVVRFGGSDRVTAFVSTTQLTAQITTADLVAAGTPAITVNNPAPGGGTSSSSTLTVNNPAPTITTIGPDNKIMGDTAFTLTVNGTNFNASSVVHLDGTARSTNFVSATQLTAQIATADLAAAGTRAITVNNPAPGGGTSGSSTLTVNNPAPTLASISPTTETAGEPGFTLTVNGTNFNTNSVVQLDGASRSTAFVSATQLTAQITAADIASVGTPAITVFNPLPGGGTSSAVNLTVVLSNPVPAVTTISPNTKFVGDAAFALTVNGSDFVSAAVVRVDGSARATTFVNGNQLTAQITLADISAGTRAITVFNPTPGGGLSNAVDLAVNNPTPSLSNIAPTSKTAGAAAFILTVNGSGFVSASMVRLDGTDCVTAFVNATQLTAQISAADLTAAGTRAITVFSPAPGGGTASAVNLTVNNTVPAITTLSPNTKVASDAAFTLTVNGTNFNSSSVVRLDGTDRTTAFVNANQVTAQITLADVAAAGTRAITVFNPAPGGGTASAVNLTVNNPAPTVTTLSPNSKSAGDFAFTLTVNGTNFNSSSVVRLAGSDRTTAFVSVTQLTAQITVGDLATAGTPAITVFNPAPGGGTSAATNLTVNNLAPTLTLITPNTKVAGDAAFTLTVDGGNFTSGSVVRLDGTDRVTSFVSATQLTAQITLADVASPGTRSITVFNPAPGGGTSSTTALTVSNSVPTTTTIAPVSTVAGGVAFNLTVNGTNFNSSSIVRLDGTDRATVFVSITQLTAQVSPADIAAPGTRAITVFNPPFSPGGGTSGPVTLTVNNPVPTITTLVPTSKIAGDIAFALTVNGTNFNASSVVRLNGTDRVTALVSATQLTAQITVADLALGGTPAITVFNPAPAGGTSNASTLTVNNPLPTTTTISPSSATAGDPSIVLSIVGTNFVSGTTVTVNGVVYNTPTIVDSSHLTLQLNATEMATAGIKPVTVTNPLPGGGTSTPALNFTVNNPLPTATILSQTSAIAGGLDFVLTVTGTSIVNGTTVNFGLINHPGTFIDATHVSATIPAADFVTAGTYAVSLTNPAPGGGTSTPGLTFTVNNPLPTLATISTPSKTAGDPAFVLTVTGTNFNASSVVQFNAAARVTTFVSATQLTAQILVTDIAVLGAFPITVFNPLPGGGVSNAVNLTVTSVPVPTVTALSLPTVPAGSLATVLTVTGTNFVVGSVVSFKGLPTLTTGPTTFVSATQLTVSILAANWTVSGPFPITVVNPAPGGGTSNALNLTVMPNITTLAPGTVRAGSANGFSLFVNGAGFVAGSSVHFNGLARSTTFISSTQLSASITALDITTVGSYPITVLLPAPTNLTSNIVNLTAIPSLGNLKPMTAVAGSGAFTLTVTGSGFVNGSVVQWNGVARTTTFVTSTQLTAAILATDVALVGAFPVTVLNPAPTNLSSNPINFTVTVLPPATECPSGLDVVAAQPGIIDSGPSRSQLWYTSDNIWWGVFSNNTDGLYFYKRATPTTWTQGALIDTNMVAGVFIAGAPDCLWDGSNLFIMIQESGTLAKFYKYSYNSTTQTFTKLAGFPLNIPLTGVGTSASGKVFGTLGIDKDSTGRIWAAYAGGGLGGDGNVRVINSTSADHLTWDTTGAIIGTGVSTLKTEGAALVKFGSRVGVAWSNLNTATNSFRYHNDADPAATWSLPEVIDSGLGPEGLGPASSKQMTMKAHPDGRIFMVANDNDGSGHMFLYIRSTLGVWGNKTLVVNDFSAAPSKGMLLLDTDNDEVHVIFKDNTVAVNGLTGQTFIVQSSMTNPAFNTSCILIDTSDDLGVSSTSNPTSTKQTVNATTDLVVAGSTGRAGNRILANSLDITPAVLTVFSLTPASKTAGEATFTLTLTGKLFASNAVVNFNGSDRTTVFVNSGKVTASISASRIATAGSLPVYVHNGTTNSNTKTFVVTATNPAPTLGLMTPNRATAGSLAQTLTVYGTGFRTSTVVRWNGSNRTTTVVSDTQLTAAISATDLTVPGAFPITLFTPTPGGGTTVAVPATTFYVAPVCTPPVGQSISGVTMFNTVKSQMWYNDGLWWGAFSDNLSGVYFYKQNGTSYTEGALLDSNYLGRPDMFWNGTNLFALVYEFNTQARLYKYSYNSTTKTFTQLAGFPVTLPLSGIGSGLTAAQIGSITLAQDSTGKLWAAYPGSFVGGDGNYHVIWSTSADHKTWNTTGYTFDVGGASVLTQEVAPIVAFGGNKVGIAYSSQPHVQIDFMYHIDGDLETTWSTKEIVASGLGHLGLGGVADNHMNLKAAPDGRLFLVAKDSDGNGWLNLYVRNAAGTWNPSVLVDPDPHSMDTRPTLMLDLENSVVYVDYSDATSNYMYLNKANMTNPVFSPACPYVSVPAVWDGTSTKQNLRASMGLQVVGSTGGPTSAIHYSAVTLTAGSGNLPVVTTISPNTGGIDSGPMTVTINGSNFAAGAVVYFNGLDRFTTFVSSTQLTARIMASDLQTLGTYPITVMNPKGGTSGAVNLTVSTNITSLLPATATATGPAFTLTVNGSGFVSGAVVRFNGQDRATSFVNATQLAAQILASDILVAGTIPVVTVNPGSLPSPPFNFVINNPAPVTTAISPANAIVGGSAFVLAVTGTNFTGNSVVSFNGLARTTTFVNNTQLTAQIPVTDIAATGSYPVAVFNPLPGGGTSAPPLSFAVSNPLPAISGLTPATVIVGSAATTLTVNGTGFVNGAVVRFNGVDRATIFVNPTQLTAQIGAADVQATGTIAITVFNPVPGGGTSSASNLAVNNPVPVVTTISPTSKTAGDAAFMLTVNGTGFVSGAIVRFNGSDRTTTFVNSTQLTAPITAADAQTAGIVPITVFSPAPGGGASNAVNFTVNNPLPTLTSISPATKTAGDLAFTMTVNGTSFVSASVVRLNGNARTTTFVSSTQLTAQITTADVQAGGAFPITVFNSAPGGGSSNAINLVVNANNPVPTIGSIAPTSKMAGDAAFSLTVNGTNYVPTSVVQWNGSGRTTTFVSATQLSAQISDLDIAAASTVNVTVLNPAPGGGTSNVSPFTINPNPRTVSAVNTSGGSSTTLSLPVVLTAQGDENGIGFSLTFDPVLLSNPQATLGADATGATLNVNSSQAASGRFGIVLSLPAGQSLAAGTRQLLMVTFTAAAVGTQTNTPVGFGDQPVVREVSNAVAEPMLTAFAPGTITITLGYEADVAPRPNGSNNGTVSIADWVQVGRFSSGLDTAAIGSEFQRADCAPRSTFGNGSITIADWVQAGRYASGLDSVSSANGPTTVPPPLAFEGATKPSGQITDEMAPATNVRLTDTALATGQQRTFSVEVETRGDENALGFSLMFDATKVTFVTAEKSDELSLATLNVNTMEADQGRVGIALALPAGRTLGPGTHQLVTLTFKKNTDFSDEMRVGFADQPVSREVVDINANSMKATFQSSIGTNNPLEDPQFFVAQQFLDFLSRPADTTGLEFWTNQIRACGNDVQCVRQQRLEVSAAFFMSPEFQQTGYTIYRLYEAAYGQQPKYEQFTNDRRELIAGPQLAASTLAFATRFVGRPEFLHAYPDTLTAAEFVNKLYENAGVNRSLTMRRKAIEALDTRTSSRGQVLLDVIENKAFKEREYNPAFVLMQYFGYLHRDADQSGYEFWLNILNNKEPGNYRGMVCSFVTSEEYQRRFSQVAPFSNAGCGQ